MVQGVYVDILLVVNFFINFLLLSLLARICQRTEQGKMRPVAAAAIGSLFSLTIFLPPMPAAAQVLLKCVSSLIMVFAAFRWKGLFTLFKEWVIFLLVTTAVYGILALAQGMYALSGMFVFDNAVYFHIRTPVFIICLTGAYALVWVANRILQAACAADELYELTLTVAGQTQQFTGFLDTGNGLSEPFSGAPVIVCGLDTASRLLSAPLLTAMLGGENEQCVHVRQIPFSAVSGSGMLPAVKGDELLMHKGETQYRAEHFYLAVSREKIGCDDWQILLNKKVFTQGTAAKTKDRTGKDGCYEEQKI